MSSWLNTIGWYHRNGYALIPLSPTAATPKDCGKRPFKGWRTAEHSAAELLAWTWRGGLHNLGVRLGPSDLVLDIDPRNGGDDSFDKMLQFFSFDFMKYPLVTTGAQGRHIYMRFEGPAPVLSNELADFPGIEWKHEGHQVVAPGSMHPDAGLPYKWTSQPSLVSAPHPEFLEFITAQHGARPEIEVIEGANITPEELTRLLDQLPVEDYASNDAWFPILAASYHATCGQGLDEFLAWSTGDPEFQEQERRISERWRSLRTPHGAKRSVGTLIREIKKYGGSASFLIPESRTEKPAVDIDTITDKSSANEVREVLRSISSADPLEQEDKIVELQKRTGRSKTALNKALKTYEREDKGDTIDVPSVVAGIVLKCDYKDSKHIIRTKEGQYWHFGGTHWEHYSVDLLKNKIKRAAERFRDEHPALKLQMSNIIQAAEIVIRAEIAKGIDLHRANEDPQPVVNCSNCELWLQKDGSFDRRPHRAESYLTHCLPIEYDPRATCPTFDRTLLGIFKDDEEIARHMVEVFGYAIQPDKWIPSYFLFHGTGSNGKSLLLETLTELLGPTARNIMSINDLQGTALSECIGALAIIDDDVDKDTVLRDGVMKKLSENKPLRARFMYHDPINFRNCSIFFLACNNWPKTKDLSDGMFRRAQGFGFRQTFKQDDALKKTILEREIPGVLNRALEGLARLRKRGAFDVPVPCQRLVDRWIARSNNILAYLDEYHNGGDWEGLKDLVTLWEGYRFWADENGIKWKTSKKEFREALESRGLGEKIGELQ